MEKKSDKKDVSVAIITNPDALSILDAAIVSKKEGLLNTLAFSSDNLFVTDSQLLLETDLGSYDEIYVIGFHQQNANKHVLRRFIINNHGKLKFWFTEKSLDWEVEVILKEIIPGKVFTNQSPESYLLKQGAKLLDFNHFLGAREALQKKNKRGLKTPLSEKFRKAIYASNIYDRLFSGKDEKKPITKRVLIELFKECLGGVSTTIINMVMEYETIKDNHKESERQKVDHPILGKMKVIKPSDDLVDRKTFFKNLGKLSAIAVAALDKDPNGQIFEVCLSKKTAESIDWKDVSYLKRINGCRFLATKDFILETQEI